MNIKDIKEIINAIDNSSINKFEIEIDNLKMSMQKNVDSCENQILNIEKNEQCIDRVTDDKDQITYTELENEENIYIVNAPLMGTFYDSGSPDESEYVKVGDKVKVGDTLCILEAMKLMNEIQSDVDGEIVEILVENEELVEYAQPIFKIRVI